MNLSKNPRVRLAELRERWDADRRSRVFLQLAEEYRRQGQPGDAIGVLEVGLSHNPSSLGGQVALGRCLLELGRLAEAKDVLATVLSKDPTQMVAYRHLIDTHLGLEEYAAARDKLEIYEQLNPSDPELDSIREQLETLDVADGASTIDEPDTTPQREGSPSRQEFADADSTSAETTSSTHSGDPRDVSSAPVPTDVVTESDDDGDSREPTDSERDRSGAPDVDERSEPISDGSRATESQSEPPPRVSAGPAPAAESTGPRGDALSLSRTPSADADDSGSKLEVPEAREPERVPEDDEPSSPPTWGEIFPLPTDLAGSQLRFGPLTSRRLSRSASAEAEATVAGHESTLETTAGEEAEVNLGSTRAVREATEPLTLDTIERARLRASEGSHALPSPAPSPATGRASGPPDSSPPTDPGSAPLPVRGPLTAERLLGLYSGRRPDLQMTPTLERRRQLVGNYLRALRTRRNRSGKS